MENNLFTGRWKIMNSYKPLCVLKASGCKRENMINIIFMFKMLPELYLTNATDYFFTFLDVAGSQNDTAEACRQGGFWGVSANRTNHKLESHLGPANYSTAVMTHVALAGRDPNCS